MTYTPYECDRIWANRQSAARSKERKMRYISELERKVQTLQTDATSLSAQLTLLQVFPISSSSNVVYVSIPLMATCDSYLEIFNLQTATIDTNGLNAENGELKLRLQTMEQQVHLQDALNDALKEEIQHLKLMTGQAISNGGHFASFGGGQQFYPNNHAMYTLLAAQKFQQLQIQSQKKQQQHQLQQQQQQFQQQQQQLQHQLHQQQQQQQTTATGTVTSTNVVLE
ncbi:hypothetical protein V8G54_023347 [Vigna mungo]|uniref:BZIP domain-containing protein n=1 Tax=Vigna mungo TaxID=3915 RepID=A0AAQ3N560_VIGMU